MIRTITLQEPGGALREGALVVPVFAPARRLGPAAAAADRGLGGIAGALLADGFAAARGETRVATVKRGRTLLRVVLLGLGEKARADAEEIADAAGAATRALLAMRVASATCLLDDALREYDDAGAFVGAFVKGLSLAPYTYSTAPRPAVTLRRVSLVVSRERRQALAPVLRRARLVAGLTVRVRDWVNTPANHMTPASLSDDIRALCRAHAIAFTAWNRAAIARAKMGAVLAVGAGSREEPRFLVLEYNATRRDLPCICLVGKGVTFDTGGISIKPWEKMHEMKSDMAGGATVAAVMAAASELGLAVRLVGLIPCVENMTGGGAYRPGDVLTTCTGETIEVLNTDAEGRLILADAVAYARTHYRPDAIVDIATLTGGVLVALGTRIAAIMGNSDPHLVALRAAGRRTGEPVWPLPYDAHYADMVKGEVSDYKNYAGRYASPITGGALIGAFARTTPWVHIDIAGTSWNDGSGPSYQARGATGYGVDLLLGYLESIEGSALKASATPRAPGASRKPTAPSRRRRSAR